MTCLPCIFDIRRGATDDGPGIRTTVFFKGCPLACDWCHNPESMAPLPEISFAESRCIGAGCSACGAVCAGGREEGMAALPGGDACSLCGKCATACPTGARRLIGQAYDIDELCAILLKDRLFYRNSGGGVTLSGGEPTLHHDYVACLLRLLKEEGIHTALQTCGAYDVEKFHRDLLPFLDLVQFDLKLVDPHCHSRHTGRDNAIILANLAALAGCAPERLVVRTPLVPEITATDENMSAISRVVEKLGIKSWELLPYNPGGIAKRRNLGKEVPFGMPETFMDREEEERLKRYL